MPPPALLITLNWPGPISEPRLSALNDMVWPLASTVATSLAAAPIVMRSSFWNPAPQACNVPPVKLTVARLGSPALPPTAIVPVWSKPPCRLYVPGVLTPDPWLCRSCHRRRRCRQDKRTGPRRYHRTA